MALLSRGIGESPPPDSLIRYLWRWGLALRNRAEEAEDGKAKRQPTLEEFCLQCGRVFSLRALLQLRVLGFGLLKRSEHLRWYIMTLGGENRLPDAHWHGKRHQFRQTPQRHLFVVANAVHRRRQGAAVKSGRL